ncbi:MAG: SusD/RagB family nutrient-binding outer membrane lipoprotein, partial [Bacteroidales bacterium]|nr:SusD/RagB family nutrient-binding outer membrane lipoprotein [Bacteroidales bacterium]
MKYIISILFTVILIFGSCTDHFEELNKSPNNPVDVPAINIFTKAIQQSVGRQAGGWIQHTYLGCWCQQWTKVQYIDEDKYEPRDMSGDFDGPYVDELADLKIVIDKATADGDDALLGAALVMKSWIYMHLTDMFGDIPYSEALQGFLTDGDITPVYDTQQAVYMGCLADLEQANTLLGSTTVNFGSGDIMYGGDPVKWQKFANSLRLRALNRIAGTPWSFTYDMAGAQSDVTTTAGAAPYAGADAAIGAILGNASANPIFSSNADDAKVVYPGLPYRNPIFNTLYARTDQGISETMVNWLVDRNDPRIHVYAQPRPDSYKLDSLDGLRYTGFQNGEKLLSALFPSISLLGTKVAYTETAPLYVLTYDETEFNIAEYYLRQNNLGQARSHYEAGVEAS